MFVNSDVSYKLIITNYVDLRKTDHNVGKMVLVLLQ